MKTKVLFMFLLLSLLFVFTSCKDDSLPPVDYSVHMEDYRGHWYSDSVPHPSDHWSNVETEDLFIGRVHPYSFEYEGHANSSGREHYVGEILPEYTRTGRTSNGNEVVAFLVRLPIEAPQPYTASYIVLCVTWQPKYPGEDKYPSMFENYRNFFFPTLYEWAVCFYSLEEALTKLEPGSKYFSGGQMSLNRLSKY